MEKEKNHLLLSTLNSQITNVISVTQVRRSLRMKMVLAIIISLLISSPISSTINSSIKHFINGNYGVYINTVVSLLISTIIITLFIQFIIIKPVNSIVQATQKAAEGDFTSKVAYKSKDEIGQLTDAFDLIEKTSENRPTS